MSGRAVPTALISTCTTRIFRIRIAPRVFSFAHFDFYRTIRFYSERVGRERLYVYPYEAFRADNAEFNLDLEAHGYPM